MQTATSSRWPGLPTATIPTGWLTSGLKTCAATAFFGNASLRYQLTDWLYLQGRIGQDYYTRPYNYNRPTGTRSIAAATTGFNGVYYQDITTYRERNLDFILGANHKFGDFGIDAFVGGNQLQQVFDRVSTSVTNFYVRDLYTIGNGQTKSPNYDYSKKKVNSLYGSAEFSYKSCCT